MLAKLSNQDAKHPLETTNRDPKIYCVYMCQYYEMMCDAYWHAKPALYIRGTRLHDMSPS